MMKKLLLALVSGIVTMGLEITGFRIFPPYFGYSIYLWGCLLSVVLLSLSVGYYLGGIVQNKFLKWIMVCATTLLFVTAASYKFFLEWLSPMDIILGSVLSSFILLFPPMLFLSMISPIVIKELAQIKADSTATNSITTKSVGISSGYVYAVSTIGSVVGTLATAFFLIPTIGSRLTLYSLSVLFLMTTVVYFFKDKKIFFLLLLLLTLAINKQYNNYPFNLLDEKETQYSDLKILEHQGNLIMSSDTNVLVHTTRYKENRISYYLFSGYLPELNNGKDILVLGTGGGEMLRYMYERNDGINVDTVEIDPQVINYGKEYFNLNETRANIIIMDARPFVNNLGDKKYDIIMIDTYGSGSSLPFYMATLEFFQKCRDHLTSGGFVAMNTPDERMAKDIATTQLSVFRHVYRIDIENTNNILVLGSDKPLKESLNGTAITEYKSAPGEILTDDKSNIEFTNYLFLKEVKEQVGSFAKI
jgi:spermidine synthase